MEKREIENQIKELKTKKGSTPLIIQDTKTLHPFVKWAGGKTQLLPKLKSFMPIKFNKYFEPFVGSGSLLFDIKPKVATINDLNSELIYSYICFQDDHLLSLLKKELRKHEENHCEDYYYHVREMDRNINFISLPIYIRAARMIYLNKTCFNGLYRVNSNGYFNVPSGRKEHIKTFDEDNFNNLREYFKSNKINILNGDFEEAVINAKPEDFVYFDPPYDVIENKNSFTSYAKNNFGKDEQVRLANLYKRLNKQGVHLMLSNHNTPFINDLYREFNIHVVKAKRMINSKANGRGNVEEVIITNYSEDD